MDGRRGVPGGGLGGRHPPARPGRERGGHPGAGPSPGGATPRVPRSAGRTWYPQSFLAPVERNEPWLSSALGVVRQLLDTLARADIPTQRTLLLGFSQGGCLALEFAARNGVRYGGVAGLAGGLIGAPGMPRDYPASLEGTPVFLGCGDRDPYVPLERLEETAEVLTRIGADVTKRVYPGMGHIVNEDQLEHVRRMAAGLVGEPGGNRQVPDPAETRKGES